MKDDTSYMRNDSRADRLALAYTPAQVEGDAVVALAGMLGRSPQDGDAVLNLSGKIGKLDRSPKKNWVENSGGLPAYIENIAVNLHEKQGMDISRAIATAVSRVKVWAAGGEGVKPDTVAKSVAALAEWEKLKGKNKAKGVVKDAKK